MLLLTGLLVGAGILRLPMEAAFQDHLKDAGLKEEALDLSMREEIGQASFVAILGGFRSLVASILSLEAHSEWEKREWGKVDSLYEIITQLQPGIGAYWDSAAWHMAYNAASDSANSPVLPESSRRQLYKSYVDKGIAYLEGGIRNSPDDYRLPAMLAMIYKDRVDPPDYEQASRWFGRAAELPGPLKIYERFQYMELAKVPGREREAYENLRRLYLEHERHHTKSLITALGRLEDKLVVPEDERLIEDFDEAADP
ncbi:hypothetical protein BH23VER1_BH23VER1_34240 [soil metagenome]